MGNRKNDELRKLRLRRETFRTLTSVDLSRVGGAGFVYTQSSSKEHREMETTSDLCL